ncbi:MAG: recombination protein RecR [Deltaproteobacteria bacterium]|nr:MAG: recombination protein RecR [Deltaproteobacteria bacterium]
MVRYAQALEKLIEELARLPGVGRKTATRFAFHILRSSPEEARVLAEAILEVKRRISLCSICFNLAEGPICSICQDPHRDHGTICVVEEAHDLLAIEAAGFYKGVYHVLHGTISPLEGRGPKDLKIQELLKRVREGGVKEVIVATNPTVEGEATALYLQKVLKPLKVKLTRIAQGIPAGGDIEYADGKTLQRSWEGRREI